MTSPSYLQLALSTSYVRAQIEEPIRTTTGVKNINSTEISNLLFPLPPRAEQDRICAAVRTLSSICDEFSERVTVEMESRVNLAASAVVSLCA